VHVIKTPVVKELVDSEGDLVPDAEDGPKRIGAKPQVGDLPEKFQTVFLWLERIYSRITVSQYFDTATLQFLSLAGTLRGDQGSTDRQGSADGHSFKQGFIELFKIHHYLKVSQTGTIIKGNKTVASETSYPTHNGDLLARWIRGENFFDWNALHKYRFSEAQR
jgi:hypothetical protein